MGYAIYHQPKNFILVFQIESFVSRDHIGIVQAGNAVLFDTTPNHFVPANFAWMLKVKKAHKFRINIPEEIALKFLVSGMGLKILLTKPFNPARPVVINFLATRSAQHLIEFSWKRQDLHDIQQWRQNSYVLQFTEPFSGLTLHLAVVISQLLHLFQDRCIGWHMNILGRRKADEAENKKE